MYIYGCIFSTFDLFQELDNLHILDFKVLHILLKWFLITVSDQNYFSIHLLTEVFKQYESPLNVSFRRYYKSLGNHYQVPVSFRIYSY